MMKRTNQSGFTLLEIMIVVSIIVILLGLAISKMGNPTAFAKTTAVRADVQSIGTQLMQYEAMNGFYPSTEQGLQALVTQAESEPRPTRWYQFFKELPKDPWGTVYIYRCPGIKHPDKYDLFSAGPGRRRLGRITPLKTDNRLIAPRPAVEAVAAVAVEDFVEWCRAHAVSARPLRDFDPVSENPAAAAAEQRPVPVGSATVE